MSNHAIHRPELILVRKGQKFSCAVGAEARRHKVAEFDGIAVDGVLFPVEEYSSPLLSLKASYLDTKKPRKR